MNLSLLRNPLDFPFRKGYLAVYRAATSAHRPGGASRCHSLPESRSPARIPAASARSYARPHHSRPYAPPSHSRPYAPRGDALSWTLPRPSRPPAPAGGCRVLDAPASVCSSPLVAKLRLRDALLEAPASSAGGCARGPRASRSLRAPHRTRRGFTTDSTEHTDKTDLGFQTQTPFISHPCHRCHPWSIHSSRSFRGGNLASGIWHPQFGCGPCPQPAGGHRTSRAPSGARTRRALEDLTAMRYNAR